jgi:hypothetical protein
VIKVKIAIAGPVTFAAVIVQSLQERREFVEVLQAYDIRLGNLWAFPLGGWFWRRFFPSGRDFSLVRR